MITVTVIRSATDKGWWAHVKQHGEDRPPDHVERRSWRLFEDNLDACAWGLKIAEKWRDES